MCLGKIMFYSLFSSPFFFFFSKLLMIIKKRERDKSKCLTLSYQRAKIIVIMENNGSR